MLVSHLHKFIFIKTVKTAGTSTEAFLEKFCIDPSLSESYEAQHSANETETKYGIIGSRWKGLTGKRKWYNHKPVKEIKRDLGKDVFDSYHKVCNIRNPYDLAVSYYHFMGNKDVDKDRFEAFLRNPATLRTLSTNTGLWSDDGEYNFNYIRMENLTGDLESFLNKVGIKESVFELPHFKKTEGRTHFRSYYNDNSKEIVDNLYGKEIKLFSYFF